MYLLGLRQCPHPDKREPACQLGPLAPKPLHSSFLDHRGGSHQLGSCRRDYIIPYPEQKAGMLGLRLCEYPETSSELDIRTARDLTELFTMGWVFLHL